MIHVIALGAMAMDVLGLAPAQSTLSAASPIPLDEYNRCVMDNAGRLEASGEAAPVVADAAMASCARIRIILAVTDEAGNPIRGDGERDKKDHALQLIDKNLREQALLKVVEDRSHKAK